ADFRLVDFSFATSFISFPSSLRPPPLQADVVLVVGARLNWILHYGEPPRWNPQATFILVDVVQDLPESERRRHLTGHAKTIVSALYKGLGATNWKVDAGGEWVGAIQAKVAKNSQSMASKLAKVKVPLDYHTTYAVILKAIAALPTPPVIVSEGANTMDIGRSLLNMTTPRARLDAGTWGTMGVGLGYAIGAAAVHGPERCVFAIEGDSAFGFSGMEVETMARYKLKIIVLVFNNNGIYGGKFEGDPGTAFPEDPTPTAFTPDLRYDLVAIGLGARGLSAATPEELEAALAQAIAGTGPTLINIVIDPFCGTESGSLQDHN
ncbi:2-hydroxyacyl-lyase-like, partial [Nannochloropsis oceanica]